MMYLVATITFVVGLSVGACVSRRDAYSDGFYDGVIGERFSRLPPFVAVEHGAEDLVHRARKVAL